MADPKISVFAGANLTATRRPTNHYKADVTISKGVNWGNIDEPNFIQGTGIKPGQEQIVISSGDQFIQVDAKQWVRVKGERDTEVGLNEQYVNKQNYTHLVVGHYWHKHYKTTTENHVEGTYYNYTGQLKENIMRSEVIYRRHDLTLHIWGNENTYHRRGNRFRNHSGDDKLLLHGHRITCIVPGREVLIPTDQKVMVGVDTSYTLGIKNSTSLLEAKTCFIEQKVGCLDFDAAIGKMDMKTFRGRVGAMCIRAVAVVAGTVRF
jgi:hypothetical protein